jgi:hypothetical protein
MNPSNDPTPVEPQQPTTPQTVTQPTGYAAPVTQPAAGSPTTGIKPNTKENIFKRKRLAYILSIVSLIIFFVAFYYGYALGTAAFLGAYGLLIGIKTKTTPLIILGSIGILLNFGFYTISVFSNL